MQRLVYPAWLAVALVLGWFWFQPPAWWPGGVVSLLLWTGMGVLVLLLVLGTLIAANLPKNVRIDLLPEDLDPPAELKRLLGDYLALGFNRAGPPMQVHLKPPVLLIGLIRSELGLYGTIFMTGTHPPRISYDMVSLLRLPDPRDNGHGILTTGPDPGGASLPASPGAFVQIFHEAPPKTLYRQHLLALEWLDQQGLPCDRATATDLSQRIREALARQRCHFLRNPPLFTLVALWRSLTKMTPHTGPLAQQAAARQQAARCLRSGGGSKAVAAPDKPNSRIFHERRFDHRSDRL